MTLGYFKREGLPLTRNPQKAAGPSDDFGKQTRYNCQTLHWCPVFQTERQRQKELSDTSSDTLMASRKSQYLFRRGKLFYVRDITLLGFSWI